MEIQWTFYEELRHEQSQLANPLAHFIQKGPKGLKANWHKRKTWCKYLQCLTMHSLLQYWVPRSLVVRAGLLQPSHKQIRWLIGLTVTLLFCKEMFSLYLYYYGTISLLHYYGTMSLRTSIKKYSKEVKNILNDFTCSVFTNYNALHL